MATERPRCEMAFLASSLISAYVSPFDSAGSNTGSQPKLCGPRAGTMVPSVRPRKSTMLLSSPMHSAIVHSAYALLSSYAASMLFRPSWPSLLKNHLTYTPGRPPRALKHSDVSSTRTGPPTACSAILHFSRATSSGSPCSSGRSSARASMRIDLRSSIWRTSRSFFSLPVTNVITRASSAAAAAPAARFDISPARLTTVGRSIDAGVLTWARGHVAR
mmetsp:Transcript_50782/g.124762  ORF Transcript_50782/g.124762 Transcript_50782/m.124762 type:complete len:218 (-) Transcript_50782:56-709(-)